MRNLVTILFLSVLSTAMPQTKYRLYLKDKQGAVIDENFVSERAMRRRNLQMVITDSLDYPVSPVYRKVLVDMGYNIVTTSRWMNTIVVASSDDHQELLSGLPFVVRAQKVWRNRSTVFNYPDNNFHEETDTIVTNEILQQVSLHNGDKLHDMGYRGDGVIVAVIDAGFQNADKISFINKNVIGARDFVYETNNPYNRDRHGTNVLSVISCDNDSVMRGSAPDASFWLLRSENSDTEFQVEEDYWIAAAEFADSIGADIINSSLAYNVFEDFESYDHSCIDGQTAFITQGANIAVKKGLFVINSAGNEGNNEWYRLCFPADAPQVLSVGSINRDKEVSDFSSRGFVTPEMVKPDVAAIGSDTYVIKPTGEVGKSSGTSFSAPVITGLVACIKQAFPQIHNKTIMDVVRESCSSFDMPSEDVGYGIPDFYAIYNKLNGLMSNETIRENPVVYPVDIENNIYRVSSGEDSVIDIFNTSGVKVQTLMPDDSGCFRVSGINKGIMCLLIRGNQTSFSSKIFIR